MNLKTLWETYFWEKMSWFYSGEKKKKKISFKCLMIWGGKREKRRIFLHRSVFFIARGSKISPRFLTLVAPLGLLISFISFSLLTDDDSILCLSLSCFFISSVSFLMERGWGIGEDAAHWYVPSCLLFSGSSSAVPSIHSSHVLCVNIVSPPFLYFLWFS